VNLRVLVGVRGRVNILPSVAVFVLTGSASDRCLSNEIHTRIAIGQKSAESVLYCNMAVLYRSVYSSVELNRCAVACHVVTICDFPPCLFPASALGLANVPANKR